MKLYVNGDSHTAGAEAANPCAFAEDDWDLKHLGRLPHPANLAVSWGRVLADTLKCAFHCDAESAASNVRIMRTTRDWINRYPSQAQDTLFIIQWSTWERQEWLIDGEYFQVNASGVDVVPDSHKQRYKEFIIGIDYFQVTQQAHEDIWAFHTELDQLGIKHIFFNADMAFGDIGKAQRYDWGKSYISPYKKEATYSRWLKSNGYDTVGPNSYHFGKEAHAAWARFMLQYIVNNKFI